MYNKARKIKPYRLKEILESANPNTINEINIAPYSSGTSDIAGYIITIGVSIYNIHIEGIDDYTTENKMKNVSSIILDSGIKYKLEPTKRYKNGKMEDYLI